MNCHLAWYPDTATCLSALDSAAAAGIRMITATSATRTPGGAPEADVKTLMDHPALLGYCVKDEPETWDLPWLKELTDRISRVDSFHPWYINYYPSWAWIDELYPGRLALYMDGMDLPFVSFDHYPIVSIDGEPDVLRHDWYYNLETVSRMCRERGLDFWAFAMAAEHRLDGRHYYNSPSLAWLRLQVFSDLVYGAQAIQYFTARGIWSDGREGKVFDEVRQVNSEVQALSPVFKGCRILDTWHTGELPMGTKALRKLPRGVGMLDTGGVGAVVSELQNGNNRYIAIVNRSFSDPMTLRLRIRGGAIEDRVEAGDIRVYQL